MSVRHIVRTSRFMHSISFRVSGWRPTALLFLLLVTAGCGGLSNEPRQNWSDLVRGYMAVGEYDKAEEELLAVLQESPGMALAEMLLARVHVARGENGQALEHFEKAVSLKPSLQKKLYFEMLSARYHHTVNSRTREDVVSEGPDLTGRVHLDRPLESMPDLLFVSIDTLRVDHLGSCGHHLALSPVIDRFFRRGTLFAAAETAIPHTNPSHITMMTSLYPHSHGVLVNGFSLNYKTGTTLSAERVTLAAILSVAGFETAAFVSNWVLHSAVSGLQQGFQLYDDILTSTFCAVPNAERHADETTDSALAWLDGRLDPSVPLFLFVHYNDPHFPYAPPQPFNARFRTGPEPERTEALGDRPFQLSQYASEVAFVDSQLGRLLRRLESRRGERDLFVLLTADHGESLLEHGYLFKHGDRLYQPSLHVPLLLWYPGTIPGSRVVGTLVETVDLMPTILDYLGISADLTLEGSSLRSLMEGRADREKNFSYCEAYAPNASEDRFSVRSGEWKFILSAGSFIEELYDLDHDPGELTNLVGKDLKAEAELRDLLTSILNEKGRIGVGDEQTIDPRVKEVLESLGYLEGE